MYLIVVCVYANVLVCFVKVACDNTLFSAQKFAKQKANISYDFTD